MARMAKKTVSYSIMHMTVAIAVAYGLTGDFAVALGIGLVEPLVQTVAYHFHERAWAGRSPKKGARQAAGGLGAVRHNSLDGAAPAGA